MSTFDRVIFFWAIDLKNAIDFSTQKEKNDLKSNNLCKRKVSKKHGVLIITILWLMFITYGSCHAGSFFDYQGINGFYGRSNWTNIGPDPVDDYEWYNIRYFLGKTIKPWLSFETSLGPGYIKTENFNETGTVEWRLLFAIHSEYLYLKLGTGAAYLFDSEDLPDLSSSNLFAIISASAGFCFRFYDSQKNGPELSLGYSVEHLSDPFKGGDDGDNGLNVGAIKVIVTWDF